MLSKHHGGEQVGTGTYLGIPTGEFVSVQQEEPLPGPAQVTYLRVPVALVLVVGPLLGLAFILFLPMAVPLALGHWALSKLAAKLASYRAMTERRYVPGQALAKGAYLNLRSWELMTVEEQEVLEGDADTRYVQIPTGGVLVLGPFLGLLFVILLPLLVPVVLAIVVLHKLQASATGLRALSMPWAAPRQPGVAYLQPEGEKRQDEEKDGPADTKAMGSIVEIAEEIARRRAEGEK